MTMDDYPSLRARCLRCLLPYEAGELVCARCNAYASDATAAPERRRESYLAFLGAHDRPTAPFTRLSTGAADEVLVDAWAAAAPVTEEFDAYRDHVLLPEGWRALARRTRLQVAYRVAASEQMRERVAARTGAFAGEPPSVAELDARAYFTAGLDVAPVLHTLQRARTSAEAQAQLQAGFAWGVNTAIDDYAGREAAVERIAQILSDKSRLALIDKAAFLPPEDPRDRPATLRYYLLPAYHRRMLTGIAGQRAEVDRVLFGEGGPVG